jgi:pilus assembly protein Flp/PilA
MNQLLQVVKELCCDEAGATAIEYSLLASLIAVVIVGAVTLIGHTFRDTFESVAVSIGNTNSQ